MTSCLIISSLDKSLDALSKLLKMQHVDTIVTCKSGSEARLCLKQQGFDFVVVNAPLSDEFGHDITLYATQHSTSGIVMLVKKQLLDEVSSKLNPYGVMCIGKPIERQMFTQAISLAISTNKRIRGFHNENVRLHEKVETIKLISRAKYALIEYLNMSEAQAHHYIEKKAMDSQTSKEDVAKEILKTYG